MSEFGLKCNTRRGLAHLGAIENDENQTKIRFFDK